MALEPGSIDDGSVQELFCGSQSLLERENFHNEILSRSADTFTSNSPHLHKKVFLLPKLFHIFWGFSP